MSKLGSQIKELREKADMLDGLEGMDNLVRMLREAADTIENLLNRLQESYEQVPEQGERENDSECESCAAQECHANGYDGAFTVFAIGSNVVVGNHDTEWIVRNPSKWFHVASFCTHVKPRTLEDVLRDVWKEALDYAESDMWRSPDEVFAERADEIRAMFGEADHD